MASENSALRTTETEYNRGAGVEVPMNEQIKKSSVLRVVVLSIFVATVYAPEGLTRAASSDQRAGSAAMADLYVSPRGNDNWSRRLSDPAQNDGPFATITRARDAVRTVRKTQTEPRTVRVV